MLENAGSYPTLGAVTRLGSPMGYRFSWEGARLQYVRYLPLEVCAISCFYRESAAAKTCRIELLVPTAEIPTKGQIGMMLSYTDSNGFLRNEQNFQEGLLNTTALDAGIGTGSWTLNGVANVTSKKVSITTAYLVKQNTEIHAKLFVMGAAPAGTHNIYLSPELLLS